METQMTDSDSHELDVALHDSAVQFSFFERWIESLRIVGEKVNGLHALIRIERDMKERVANLHKEADAVGQIVAQGDAAKQRLDDLNAAIAKVDERLNAILTAGRSKADEIIGGGRKDAKSMAATARLAADQLLADARARASGHVSDLTEEIRANEEKLLAQTAEIAARQAVLDDINRHIAEARAKILAT
jgi:hypothetical protein